MNMVILLLVVVIVLQIAILYSIRTSRNVQVATTTAAASEVGKALDWVDSGLANSLEEYRGFSE